MSTVTESATITLVHAVGGVYAEIADLPMQVGLQRQREMALLELATTALRERYPQLRVSSFSIESETRVHLWIERL